MFDLQLAHEHIKHPRYLRWIVSETLYTTTFAIGPRPYHTPGILPRITPITRILKSLKPWGEWHNIDFP